MDYMSYQSNAAEVPVMRKWIVRMFFLSLLLHLGLLGFFRVKKLQHFTPMSERLVPRAFSVQRLDVDPKLLRDDDTEWLSVDSSCVRAAVAAAGAKKKPMAVVANMAITVSGRLGM